MCNSIEISRLLINLVIVMITMDEVGDTANGYEYLSRVSNVGK